jgi:hypothetical protein
MGFVGISPGGASADADPEAEKHRKKGASRMDQAWEDIFGPGGIPYRDHLVGHFDENFGHSDKASGSLLLKLLNGQEVELSTKNINGKEREFIRLSGTGAGPHTLTQEAADGFMALGRSRGWKKVDIYGSDQEKDMLWLAAQREGLEVKNHEPSPAMKQKWAEEMAQKKDSSAPEKPSMEKAHLPALPAPETSAAEEGSQFFKKEAGTTKPMDEFSTWLEQKREEALDKMRQHTEKGETAMGAKFQAESIGLEDMHDAIRFKGLHLDKDEIETFQKISDSTGTMKDKEGKSYSGVSAGLQWLKEQKGWGFAREADPAAPSAPPPASKAPNPKFDVL